MYLCQSSDIYLYMTIQINECQDLRRGTKWCKLTSIQSEVIFQSLLSEN